MIVSNNNLMTILLPDDNKVLKEALQNADKQTIQNLKAGSTSASEIIKNLFVNLKTGEKTTSNIENLLKNNAVFKDNGNFSKSINTLIEQIKSDSNLSKFTSLLQNFSQDITKLNDVNLKDKILNSGIFLEAKALKQSNLQSNFPKNIESSLIQLKELLKSINSLEANKINNSINAIIQNNSNSLDNNSLIKTLISQLEKLLKNISDPKLSKLNSLINQLKNISSQGELLESKLSNNIQTASQQELLNLNNNKQNIANKTIDTLTILKNEFQTNSSLQNKLELIKQIDSLINSANLFSQNNSSIEPKTLLSQLSMLNELKLANLQNSNINPILNNLKDLVNNINTLESKVMQNQNIQNEKLQLTNNIQNNLNTLKAELTIITNTDLTMTNKLIDKLLGIQNIFLKIEIPLDLKNLMQNFFEQNTIQNNFKSNFESNINNLILNLKETIVNLSSNQNGLNLQQNIISSIEKLETILNNLQQNQQNTNPNLLKNDFKGILLQIQNELITKTDSQSQEILKQVDKMVSQIEYHQLLSLVSNSNNVYVPFLWNMLDEGSISFKKIDEEKFYCEINLSLKDFGQTKLLLALYDKNKLDLTIYASDDNFKQIIRENLTKLKQALNSADLIPVNINIINLKKEHDSLNNKHSNTYNQEQNINLGIDIRA